MHVVDLGIWLTNLDQKEIKKIKGLTRKFRKNNIVCYACNKIGHIAKYCCSKNPLATNENTDEKGKEKVEDI